MEQLRAWTLSFCFACVVAGLLGQLSSERNRFSVIKLVLALYIVTAALAPLQGEARPSAPTLPAAEAAQIAPAPDPQALAVQQAQQTLADAVGQALSREGIAHSAIAVRLFVRDGSLEVEQVTVTAPPGQNADAVRKTIARALGADVPVVLQEEGS